MRNYRPNICAFLAFVVLAGACTPPGGPVVTAQSPPMPEPTPVVVPVVPTPTPDIVPPTPDIKPGVTIPAQTPIGKRLIATFCPPHDAAKCVAQWRWLEIGKDGWTRPATTLDALVEGDRALIWAQPGNYRVEVVAACPEGIESYSADFTVGEPAPPGPAKTLAELAGKDAGALSLVYQSMLPLVEQFGQVRFVTEFANVKLGPLKDNPAALEVGKKLAALGAPESAVDAKQLGELLASVIRELDAPGPAPVPTPGKKRIVILREASEPTAALARLITELRAGASAKYLADKGHALEILDDESTRPVAVKLKAEGVTLPALFILDGDAVTFKAGLAPDATGANVIETIRQHGG